GFSTKYKAASSRAAFSFLIVPSENCSVPKASQICQNIDDRVLTRQLEDKGYWRGLRGNASQAPNFFG
ncbi:MAG: hypothetical protein P8O69_11320, partial [Amylibacter sp.]|nr:hypothetical protein [Amylibacter sp.]